MSPITGDNSLLDKSIAIIIVLFILSLISERFITWFKLYFFKKGNTLFGLFNWEDDYSSRSGNPEHDKERERRILLLNLILSVCIALLAHADLFKILQAPSPFDALGWKSNEWSGSSHFILSILKSVAGCILGGLFISLGSKFWHDTLEMLFYTKNLKQKLSDPDTYNVNNVNQLDEFLAITDLEIVSSALVNIKDEIKLRKGVIGIGIGCNNENGRYILDIMVDSTAELSSFPPFIAYLLSSGKEIKVPVRIILATIPAIHVRPADSIANEKSPTVMGSVGCIVEDDNKNEYILTCFHAVIDPGNTNYIFDPGGNNSVLSPADRNLAVGKIANGIRNAFVDAAIVSLAPENPELLSNDVESYGTIKNVRNVYEGNDNKCIGSNVYVRGLKSKGKLGRISHLYYDVLFDYGPNQTHMLHNLIVISNKGKGVSEHGDSGAPVLDFNDNLIGIVVGGNDVTTYVIPIHKIFYFLKIKIKTNAEGS